MRKIFYSGGVLKYLACLAFTIFVGCGCQDPRGCPAIGGVGNTPNEVQTLREGRDYQTYQSTRMPMPPQETTDEGIAMPEPLLIDNRDTLVIDNKLKFQSDTPATSPSF